MRKRILLGFSAIFAMIQVVDSQNVIVNATKSGYVQNTSATENVFYETVIRLKDRTVAWSRIGYLEVPITESTAPSQVDLKVYFYKPIGSGDLPLEFATMAGALPADLSFVNQPAESSLTIVETLSVNSATEGWVTVDLTEEYNTALLAGESALTVRMVSDQSAVLVEFYSLATGTDKKPHLSIASDCPPEYNAIEKVLVVGESIVIGGETVTESGIYQDVSTTSCGAEKIDTYYVLFIIDGTVTNDVAICEGSSHEVQVGPNTYETYDAEGQYTAEVTSDDGTATQKIITNITVNPLPDEIDLGDDQVIRESGSYTLDAGPGYSSYKWLNNGKVIDGEVSQQLVVTMSKDAFNVGINEIEVIVTNEYGCEAGSNVVWIDIKGHLFAPVQDSYAEHVSDKFQVNTALRVKIDSDISQDPTPGYVPHWNRESFLQFDLSNEEIISNMTNYRLRLYLYAVSIGNGVKDTLGNIIVSSPFYQPVSCHFLLGGFDQDGDWESRPMERTILAAPVNIRIDSLKAGFIEWDIHELFTKEILDKNIDVFTIILSAPNDPNSHMSSYRSSRSSIVSERPVIVYDVKDPSTRIEEPGLEEDAINLYPNPVSDILHFNNTRDHIQVSIYDITGRKLLSKQNEDNYIDVSTLKTGVYIIRFDSNTHSISRRFIKK